MKEPILFDVGSRLPRMTESLNFRNYLDTVLERCDVFRSFHSVSGKIWRHDNWKLSLAG